jgi:hypothetical protein
MIAIDGSSEKLVALRFPNLSQKMGTETPISKWEFAEQALGDVRIKGVTKGENALPGPAVQRIERGNNPQILANAFRTDFNSIGLPKFGRIQEDGASQEELLILARRKPLHRDAVNRFPEREHCNRTQGVLDARQAGQARCHAWIFGKQHDM